MRREDAERVANEMSANGNRPGKLDLIKELRSRFGVDLKEAHDMVETIYRGRQMPPQLVDSDVETMLSGIYAEQSASGKVNLIEMIKTTRQRTGLGLKESKDLVEAYVKKRNPELANQRVGCLGGLLGIGRF